MIIENRDILSLQKADIKPASLMLARAFNNDPINSYAYPDEIERGKKLPYAYEFILRYGLRYGETHISSQQLEGIALWVRSNRVSMTLWRLIISGAFWPTLKMGQDSGRRMQILSRYLEDKHKEMAPFPHWYLMLLGVDPEFQGKGYAGRLLRAMFALTGADGLPYYLETETERNVSFYEHFGFKVLDTCILPGTKLKLWLMLRKSI